MKRLFGNFNFFFSGQTFRFGGGGGCGVDRLGFNRGSALCVRVTIFAHPNAAALLGVVGADVIIAEANGDCDGGCCGASTNVEYDFVVKNEPTGTGCTATVPPVDGSVENIFDGVCV